MKKNNRKKVFVGMSGGVDSSVAAFLLKKQGYDVVGIFMKCFNIDGCVERDAEDARRVAEKLKIPFYIWDFEEEYKNKVVKYMVKGYKNGITPNPDVMCNREIKFGLFLEKALEMGADYVATGHYVRLSQAAFRKQHNFLPARKFASLSPRHSSLRSGTELSRLRDVPQGNSASPLFSLFIAKDKNKDQSYFLWTLTQKQLEHCLFPIGDYLKSDVRQIARKAGLSTAEKKDSQGICFLGKVSIGDFLKKYISEKKGSVLNINGEKIGEHKGAHFYTIGQRHGLGIGGSEKPYYIVKKDVKKNIIVVAKGDDNPALFKKEIKLTNVNFINPLILNTKYSMPIMVRVRYRQPLVSAILKIENSKLKIKFDQSVKFVAPGQSAVFYLPAETLVKDGNKKSEMIGGGIII